MIHGRPLRDLWSFDPDMVFLNIGAFGAVLREVQQEQDRWRARMERQTARFFMSDLPGLIRDTVGVLAPFLGADPARTVMVENVSGGIMAVLNAVPLAPGDKIVTTTQVYNAVRQAMAHVAGRAGAQVIECPLPVPMTGEQAALDAIAAALDDHVRLVVIDHVASPTALVLPVARIVALCHGRGIPVLVDGAHAPGLLDLNVDDIGADWYVGNCHKWLCGAKGAAFIVFGPGAPFDVHPVVISHAFGQGPLAEFGKIGTRDPTAWLSVPVALAAHDRLGGAGLRARNRAVALVGGHLVADALGTEMTGPDDMLAAMVAVRVPGDAPATPERAAALRETLWRDALIELQPMVQSGALWVRMCAFAATEPDDFARVAEALTGARAP